jgi:hypothetical protein
MTAPSSSYHGTDPNIGDHIRAFTENGWQHGIYIGGGTVIHLVLGDQGPQISMTLLSAFTQGARIHRVNYREHEALPGVMIVQRAFLFAQTPGAAAIFSDPESFCRWCTIARPKMEFLSEEVQQRLSPMDRTLFFKPDAERMTPYVLSSDSEAS